MLTNLTDDSIGAGAAAFIVFIVLVEALLVAFGIWLYWRLVSKTGWPGWYSLGTLVPLLNLALIVMAAFKEWPIEAENRMLRQQLAYGGYSGAPGISGYPGYGGFPVAPQQAPGYPTTQPGHPTVAEPGSPPPAPPGYQGPDLGKHPND